MAIDTPLRRSFDYLLPEAAGFEPLPGLRVWVPFGRRKVVGIVLDVKERSEVPPAKLRRVLGALEDRPVLDAALLELLVWAADYYKHPVGEVVAAALPAAVRKGTDGRKRRSKAASPAAAGGDSPAAAVRAAGAARLELSAAQQFAVASVAEKLDEFGVWLLDGVTGSGKTEVYLRTIETVLARGLQALVLVPEIALTPQLLRRFEERFAVPIAVLHSSLTDKARLGSWRDARAGAAGIVLGTRSAVFAPLARPGIIIVDEEHDPSFKQQDSFRYSARDLAIVRAQRLGLPIILGSATPSLEALSLVQRGKAVRLELPQRAGSAQPPRWSLVDLRQHAAAQGLATPTLLSIERHLQSGAQVLLYLNRRGYAPVLFCPGCGWAAGCPRCDARLTLHRREARLVCHHCGQVEAIPVQCPECKAEIRPVGQGTERLEETLARIFAGVPIARIDTDTMRRRHELESMLASVDAGEVRLLVGTQMLSKGHHFPRVTLVVIVNADQGLFGTDFRASERLAQAIVQVAGRSGRAEHPGEVLIQTAYPEHPLLQTLLHSGYAGFAESALAERARAGWPPYSRLALVRAEAATPSAPLRFLEAAVQAAQSIPSNAVTLFGPAPAPMRRRAGHFREQLLLQAKTPSALHALLNRWIPRLEALPEARRVRWSVDVDPAELF